MAEAYPGNALFSAPWPAAAGFAAAISACGDYLQACASVGVTWQTEIARFADRRLGEHRRAWTALLSSRDLGRVLKIQRQWGLQAATDYTGEATRIARLVTSVGLTGTTPEVHDVGTLLG